MLTLLLFALSAVTNRAFVLKSSPISNFQLHRTTTVDDALVGEQLTSTLKFFRVTADTEVLPIKQDKRRIAVYLPGIDGYGTYAIPALQNLTVDYDLFRLEVQPSDRSTFVQLAEAVIARLKLFNAPVLLIGESSGGLVALYIAATAKALISTLCLVNPASSYDRTLWSQLSPFILNSGRAFPVVGMGTLFATIVQPAQFTRISSQIISNINAAGSNAARLEQMNELFGISQEFLKMMSPENVEWRLTRWLENGNLIMRSRYQQITVPTLLLIGTQDRLLPSRDEGYRLQRVLVNAAVELKEFRSGGHALLDGTIDLTNVLRTSRTLGPPRERFPIDVAYPSQADIDTAEKSIFPRLLQAFSPVFLRRDGAGSIRRGIDELPVGQSGRPVLLVGNHQLFGFDAGLIVREFLRERNVLVRSLAHPILFGAAESMLGAFPARDTSTVVDGGPGSMFVQDNLNKFGVVEVSPGSIFELMKRNETILLFPGGANEACHGKNEAYTLKWKERVDFVRMAAAFDAIIVPFGAIGIADSVNMVLDGADLRGLPIVGASVQRFNDRLPRAQAGVAENFSFPLVTPKLPRRIYFLFDKPFDTRAVSIKDKAACQTAYVQIKTQVESCMETLLKFREDDPYDRFAPRIAYETLFNGKQAPTAPL